MTRRIHIDAEDDRPQLVPVGRSAPALRAAVLCPAPSLSRFEDTDAHDLCIGVNRAAGAMRCDYWVALDVHTAGITTPRGEPVVVNKPNIHRQMCGEFPYVSQLAHLSVEGLRLRRPGSEKINWQRFGLTVAVVLAAELGAARVDCFGVDWCGQSDFDGFRHIRNRRTESRWQRERQLYHQVVAALAERGVLVRRMTGGQDDGAGQLQLTDPRSRQ
jgi:hypothetical protein